MNSPSETGQEPAVQAHHVPPKAPLTVVCLGLAVLLAPAVQADFVGSHASINNLSPDVMSAELLLDPATSGLLYRIEATDGNGVEDLTVARLDFLDADGTVAHTHDDDAPTLDARRAAVWTGLVLGPAALLRSSQVQVIVFDQADGESEPTTASHLLPPDAPAPKPAPSPAARIGLLADTVTVLAAQNQQFLIAAAGLAAVGAAAAYLLGRVSARPGRD